jgi:FkbM family methyltransferase
MSQFPVFLSPKQIIKILFPKLWIEIVFRFRKERFEKELYLIPILCNKQQTAIDIGANQGIYTYCMAKHARKVISFEPNFRLRPALNRIAGSNVVVQMEALSDARRTVKMRLDPTNNGLSTIEPRNHFLAANQAVTPLTDEVITDTLDSFQLSDISVIKIDVEGHEEAVLSGARKTIYRNKPVLIVESENQHNRGAPDRVNEFLTELGYKGFFIKDRRLKELSELNVDDMQVENRTSGMPYVNNFIFVPAYEEAIIERLRVMVNSLR